MLSKKLSYPEVCDKPILEVSHHNFNIFILKISNNFPDKPLIFIDWSISCNTFGLLIFIEKCKVAIVYELSGQPTYLGKNEKNNHYIEGERRGTGHCVKDL